MSPLLLGLAQGTGQMAKGNNGNYLQHSVEVAVAQHLIQSGSGQFHVCLTHGMAPYERCGIPSRGQTKGLLLHALEAAADDFQPGEPPIVGAYRKVGASLDHYPNSAELIAALTDRRNLRGGITEVESAKIDELRARWHGSGVVPVGESWRKQVDRGRVLTCPRGLDYPWLFSMDPMTYREHGFADDANLYRDDQGRIGEVLARFVLSGQPGVATIFVYAIRLGKRADFWSFADDIAVRTKMTMYPLWLTHQGGNRNLAAVLTKGVTMPNQWVPCGVNAGRD